MAGWLARLTALSSLLAFCGCGGSTEASHSGAGGPDAGGNSAADRRGGGSAEPGGSAAGNGGTSTAGSAGSTATHSGGTETTATEPDADAGCSQRLVGAPLLFSPTLHGFGVNAVVCGDPSTLRARIRAEGATAWGQLTVPSVRAADLAEWSFEGLRAGTEYEYQIVAQDDARDAETAEAEGRDPGDGSEAEHRDGGMDARGRGGGRRPWVAEAGSLDAGSDAREDRDGPDGAVEGTLYSGTVVTERQAGEPFAFALITDSHIGADLSFSNQGIPTVLSSVSSLVGAAAPDFVVNLGDMLDFHEYGFNDPPPDRSVTRQAYVNYRTLLGDTLGHVPHFPVIGNWEGEDGTYTDEEIARSRDMRLLYMAGPGPTTYPQGGSPAGDYYAFTWGDALFVVLNVMSYTKTPHLLSYNPGVADDWTLGEAQLAWLTNTLTSANSPWRFLLIHHTVGGAAGDEVESAYGRGGGQAAHVGEQARVHQLMLDHGVQVFFYGHDHVFADMTVDGIHYTMPGNAGAPWMFGPDQTGYEQSWLEAGWARVDVSRESVHVQFLSMGNELLYEYTLN